MFVNLEDETGHVNVIFSKGAWARWRHVAASAPALVIRGRLERAQGALAVNAEHVEALELGAPRRGLEGLPLTWTDAPGGRVRSTRIIAVAAVVVLAALVAGAVTLAATTTSPPRVDRREPRRRDRPTDDRDGRAHLLVELGHLDQRRLRVRLRGAGPPTSTATASLSIVTATVEARLGHGHLYLHVPQFASLSARRGSSTGQPRGPTRLDELAATMRRPDLSRLHAARHVLVHSDGSATTTLRFGLVHLPSSAGLPISLPATAGSPRRVVTGAQGQLLEAAARPGGPQRDGQRCTSSVTGYNVPVAISAPEPSDVVVLSPSKERAIFGTNAPAIGRDLRGLRRLLRRGR